MKAEALERTRHESKDEDERQQLLREEILKLAGTISGGNPDRAENARSEVRARIARQHGR